MKYYFSAVLFFAIFCFSSCKVKKQLSASLLNEQAQKYLEDYDEFVDTLTAIHPALYEFTSRQDFEGKVAQLRSEINNSTSDKEFIWKLGEIIALVGCGHSSLGFFNQQRDLLKSEEYFPLLTRLIDGKLYVIDNLINKDLVEKGEEITHINGKPVAEILDVIFAHINTQAYIESVRIRMFNGYNTSYLAYALGFPDHYTIKVNAKSGDIVLRQLSENPPYAPLYSKQHPCQNDFCLDELNEETALLTIRNYAYYGERTEVYTRFLDESFEEIQNKNYKNLIIDVRGNLGGPGAASIHLLKYTLQEPFYYFANDGSDYGNKEQKIPFENNFNGQIAFVMSGEGFSSVGHLASIYKDKGRVVFVGETLGANQFCTANQKQFKLSHTGFTYTVARNIFFTAVKEKNTKARINPDFAVEQSIEDYLIDKDIVLERAVDILSQ